MIKKDHEIFKNSTNCWICKKSYEVGEVKVKLRDPITERYQECNKNMISK